MTPQELSKKIDLAGMMAHVEAVMQRFRSEIVNPGLATKADSSSVYTKAQTDNMLAAMKSGLFVSVNTLPTASADTLFKIYLVPAASSKTSNVKDEWITIITSSSTSTDPETGEEVTTYTYDWEKIGSTEPDLSGKADKDVPSAAGNIAALDASGNLTDSGKTLGKSVPADAVFTDTTYSNATPSTSGSGGTDGLMSAADKEKLDGVETGADVTDAENVKAALGTNSTHGGAFLRKDGNWVVPANDNTTYSLGVGTGADADKIVLTPSSGNADKITVPYASDAGTVNGKTVAVNVPSDAVFTDHTYKLTVNGQTAGSGSGTDLGAVYAPTTAGTEGQMLIANASGIPAWGSKPSYAYGEIGYEVATQTTSGAVTIDGTKPLHIVTLSGAATSVAFSTGNLPAVGHLCHVIFTASTATTVSIAHVSTGSVRYICPEGSSPADIDVPAGGYAEVDFLRGADTTESNDTIAWIYVRGV